MVVLIQATLDCGKRFRLVNHFSPEIKRNQRRTLARFEELKAELLRSPSRKPSAMLRWILVGRSTRISKVQSCCRILSTARFWTSRSTQLMSSPSVRRTSYHSARWQIRGCCLMLRWRAVSARKTSCTWASEGWQIRILRCCPGAKSHHRRGRLCLCRYRQDRQMIILSLLSYLWSCRVGSTPGFLNRWGIPPWGGISSF